MTDRSWVADLIQAIADLIQGRALGDSPPGGTPLDATATIPVVDPAQVPAGTKSVGVIFVHGIGTQPPRETFLNWSNAIVEMLSEWRRGEDAAAGRSHKSLIGENPVQTGAVECGEGCDERAWTRIDIPETPGHPAKAWLITEAYWAGVVRAPGFAQAMTYLRKHIQAIIKGIADGYGPREERRNQRNEDLIRDPGEPLTDRVKAEIAELRVSNSWRWGWIEKLDSLWSKTWVRRGLGWSARIGAVITLAIYAPIRAIPIKAIRDRAELAAIDAQLVDAFGDLPVLLDDPVQAAIIRQRLVATIDWVRARGCDEVVLIAHSGGAIVSFATLLDPAYRDRPVAKLITLGQGLSLGWRLERVTAPFLAGNPIRGDLGAARPDLRWVDFWGTYDPAPAGPFPADIESTPLKAVPVVEPGKPVSPIQIESRAVTNYMHMAKDHDGYWPNDEGFLVPLVRHLDDPRGDGGGSRFYRSRLGRTIRIERRRRRVGLLLAWRWLSLAAGISALLIALLPWFSVSVSLATTGDALAAIWSKIPAHELISGPIDGIGDAIASILAAFGANVRDRAAEIGPALLGAVVPILAAFAIYSRGVGLWETVDASERKAIRREDFGAPGSAWAKSEGILIFGGLVGVVLGALDVPIVVMIGWFLGTVVLSALMWLAFRRTSAGAA